jgi:DNA-binding FrmR family transcriptional regulator
MATPKLIRDAFDPEGIEVHDIPYGGMLLARIHGGRQAMHTAREREKLIARVRRIRGQIEGIERAIVEEKGCYEVLQTVTAARGALNSLVAEMNEDHVRFHVLDPEENVSAKRARAAEELIDIVRAYVK